MRSMSSAIAPLVVMVVVGCSYVDADQCWPNTSGGFGGSGTIPIGAGVGVSSGDFPGDRPLDNGGTSNPCVTPDKPKTSEKPPSSPGTFAGIDPGVLNKTSLGAAAFMSYMDEKLTSDMVDLNDADAVTAAFTKDAPDAEATVNAWLATLDPSAIPAVGITPRYECTAEHGCSYMTRCLNPGSWSTEGTTCLVTDCGDGKCSTCPWFFPDMLKSILIKGWCSYTCMDTHSPPNIVARGGVVIKPDGHPFPKEGLAWCVGP